MAVWSGCPYPRSPTLLIAPKVIVGANARATHVTKPLASRAKQLTCPECGKEFTPKRHDQTYDTPACRFEAKNRAWQRGLEAYRAVYHLVTVTGSKARGLALNELTQTARRWRDEDRAAGKPPPPLPAMLKDEAHKEVVRERYARLGQANCPY